MVPLLILHTIPPRPRSNGPYMRVYPRPYAARQVLGSSGEGLGFGNFKSQTPGKIYKVDPLRGFL